MRNTYVVCYDIADPKRWRRVHKMMLGHGDPLQLSVFLCELSPTERQQLLSRLDDVLNHAEDALAIVDLGPAQTGSTRVTTFGTARWEGGKRVLVV